MWLAGVPIETIASIMGHESTEMTLRDIGVNLSDHARAFEAVRNLRSQMQEIPEIVPSVALPDVQVDRRGFERLRSQYVTIRIQSAWN